jgi:hypothetical protein
LRKVANGAPTQEERNAAFNPIMNLINDFLIAYSQSPNYDPDNVEAITSELVINVANAIKAISELSPGARPDMIKIIKREMRKTVYGPQDRLQLDFSSGDAIKMLDSVILLEAITMPLVRADAALDSQLEAALEMPDGPEKEAELDRIDRAQAIIASQTEALRSRVEASTDEMWDVNPLDEVVHIYQLEGDLSDPAVLASPANVLRKTMIIDMLSRNNNINRFLGKADPSAPNKKMLDLWSRVHKLIHTDPAAIVNGRITGADWSILASWAISAHINEQAAAPNSDYALMPATLGSEGALVRSFMDRAYTNLVDRLVDPGILREADCLRVAASMGRAVSKDSVDVANVLMRDGSLFDLRKFGKWTSRVPVESMSARKKVEGSATEAAIALEGQDPNRLSSLLGAVQISSMKPAPKHFTTTTYTGEFVDANFMFTNALHHLGKLHKHFVKSVELSSPTVAIDQEDLDFLAHCAFSSDYNADVEEATGPKGDLRVLDMIALDAALERIRDKYTQRNNGNPIQLQVTIEYVDVDKQPSGPGYQAWANNIFFDGLGRESHNSSLFGALAAMYFGTEGFNKLGQQGPLNAISKNGARFRQYVTTTFGRKEALGWKPGDNVGESLMKLAGYLLSREFPTAEFAAADINALYKLMKMRHIVIVTNPEGVREAWWPQRYIEMEAQGTLPAWAESTKVELVPLSESVAQTLWSESGMMGVRDRVSQKMLNIQDISTNPSLSLERLRSLGLEALLRAPDKDGNRGTVRVDTTPLAAVTRSGRAFIEDTKNTWVDILRKRFKNWETQRDAAYAARANISGTSDLNYKKITQTNNERLEKALSEKALITFMRRLGVPFSDAEGEKLAVTGLIKEMLKKYTSSNPQSVTWFHDHEGSVNPGEGILARASLENDFADFQGRGPTYGDVVLIDVASIARSVGSKPSDGATDVVMREVKRVIASYAKRGLVVSVVSGTGAQDIIYNTQMWMDTGELGYHSLSGSPHFYVPDTAGLNEGATYRAEASSLTESQSISTDGVAIGIATDQFAMLGAVENNGYYDPTHDPQSGRVSATIIPSAILATGKGADNRVYTFNIPRGSSERAKIENKLGALLEDDEWIDHFVRLSGNPPGVPIARYNPENGRREPGVKDCREALLELRDALKTGKYLPEEGQTLSIGTMIPTISPTGQIYITRVGFAIPSVDDMSNLLGAGLGQTKIKPGVLGSGVAIAPPKLEQMITTPPGDFQVRRTRNTPKGLVVEGRAAITPHSKTIFNLIGFKFGATPLPQGLSFKDVVIKAAGAAGARITRIIPWSDVVSKESKRGLVHNMRELFLLGGINFQPDLMKFFYGATAATPGSKE